MLLNHVSYYRIAQNSGGGMRVCMHLRACMCVCVYACVCACMRGHACMRVCVHLHVCVCASACVCVYWIVTVFVKTKLQLLIYSFSSLSSLLTHSLTVSSIS